MHWDVEAIVQTPKDENIGTTLTPVSPLDITLELSREKKVVMDQLQENLMIFLVMIMIQSPNPPCHSAPPVGRVTLLQIYLDNGP